MHCHIYLYFKKKRLTEPSEVENRDSTENTSAQTEIIEQESESKDEPQEEKNDLNMEETKGDHPEPSDNEKIGIFS